MANATGSESACDLQSVVTDETELVYAETATQSPFFSVTELQPCTTCLRMVSQGNEQIQEKLRRHHLSVSERCS